MTTVNTMIITAGGDTVPAVVTAKRTGRFGICIRRHGKKYETDAKDREIILKVLTAMIASDFFCTVPGIEITVSDCGENRFTLTAAVAAAILIETKQIRPDFDMNDIIIAGDLKLDGTFCPVWTGNDKGLLMWPDPEKKVMTDHKKMHIVPKGTDMNLWMTMHGPFTVEAHDLRHLKCILENRKEA